jgi:hemerythrin-like metal-binding protein
MDAMSLFKWSPSHSVYLPEIDSEHRAIYGLGNKLHEALAAGTRSARLQAMAEEFKTALEEHFRHEERLMSAIHYTSATWHKKQHDVARRFARGLVRQVSTGLKPEAGESLEAIADWMNDHLRVADRMMGARLRNYLRFNTSLAS